MFHKHGFGSIKVGKKLNSRLNQKQFFVKLFNALVWWLAFVKKLYYLKLIRSWLVLKPVLLFWYHAMLPSGIVTLFG